MMAAEKLSFVLHRFFDGKVFVDLLLGPTFDAKVPELKRIQLALQDFNGVSALVHEVNLSYDPNCPIAFRVYFPCKL